MSEKTNGKTEEDEVTEGEDVKEIHSIMFEFSDLASVNFKVTPSGQITPLQLLALSSWLEFEGKYSLSRQKATVEQAIAEEQRRNQISTPGQGIILPK